MAQKRRVRQAYADDPVLVGRRLRSAREAAGLSQRALSFPGCTAAYISRIEAGERWPSLQLLREFAHRLGVTEEFLAFGHDAIQENDNDLTTQHKGEPLGERIIVHGHVYDEDRRPVPETLVEIWQANACGRYVHNVDQHPAPLDPNFTGAGRTVTDKKGYYKFITVKPGAYPWGNHHNAWRPNHIHFSVFGQSFLTRLVTQMYFPGDPLFPFDPIFNSVTDEKARLRMVSSFDLDNTIPDWALCFRFDIVLRGREQTPTHTEQH